MSDTFIPGEVVLQITFLSDDIKDMADAADVPYDTAIERVHDWADAIEDTMTGYCAEQLESVVKFNQP